MELIHFSIIEYIKLKTLGKEAEAKKRSVSTDINVVGGVKKT
jgi:hypothetical protein